MSTPLHTVKEQFGSKEALVEKLAPMLDRQTDESEADFKARLLQVSNSKLLKLLERENDLRERFGSREALVDAIVGMQTLESNSTLRERLLTQSTGRLLSTHWGLSRKSKS